MKECLRWHELSELGIENVVAMTQPDWQAQAKALTDGQPIVRAVDSISGQAARDLLDLLSNGGVFVSFGSAVTYSRISRWFDFSPD